MEHIHSRKAAWRMGATISALCLALLARAGTFSFTAGSWSNLTGTASTNSSLYTTYATNGGTGGSLTLNASSSGSYTLGGTWSFTVTWTPDNAQDVAPANVQVTLTRTGTMNVDGNGFASIVAGTTQLFSVDSTTTFLSGITWYLPDVVITLPLTAQSDGTYSVNGTVTSDTLNASYNSQTTTTSTCMEGFAMGNMVGSN